MAEGQKVEIKEAKGRPMLTWVGKQPLRHVTAFPAQHIESFSADDMAADPDTWLNWPQIYPKGGLLFHGDNKEVLAHLLANGFRGKVDLIYIDPPFDSGADYLRRVELRGIDFPRTEGEYYEIGEQIQYTDIWVHDNYLQFMYERLILIKELLSDDGSIWLHCDWRKSHHLRLLMDEVIGADNFRAQVAWRSMTSSGYKGKKSLGRSHADILYYSKSENLIYNPLYLKISEEMLERYKHEDPDGRKFKDSYLGDALPETIEQLRSENRLYITSTGGYRIKHYLDEAKGTLVDDVWVDIDVENSQALVQTGYPTQKPEALLERIISLTSNPEDVVLDCFIGSGTTAAVAQKLGRRWIGCDINKGAIQTTTKRLQTIIQEQFESLHNEQDELPGLEECEESFKPSQLSFAVYRVNDYDLQIQNNEAVDLACEHIGIQRTRSDAFFDGTHGKKLAKIIPFNHPCYPLDLEEIKRELQARPEEERDITVVCLGKETAIDAWLEDWNRLRKRGDVPNKFDVIELRTDPRYGKFFIHQPATAKVDIHRVNKKIIVDVQDFISPSIIERLKGQAGILAPQIQLMKRPWP